MRVDVSRAGILRWHHENLQFHAEPTKNAMKMSNMKMSVPFLLGAIQGCSSLNTKSAFSAVIFDMSLDAG